MSEGKDKKTSPNICGKTVILAVIPQVKSTINSVGSLAAATGAKLIIEVPSPL
jgi:hypothetical protein